MVSPQVFPEDGNARNGITEAVGTGQWILTESVKDKHYVFTRNENYWGEKPKYKKVIVKIIPNAATRVLALKSGQIDIIYGSNLVSQEAFNQLRQDKNLSAKISRQTTRTRNILLNTNSELLKDLNVRKAMAHGLNKQEIIDSVLYGMEEKADFVIHPKIPYCNIDETPYEYNKAKAEELLDNAGWIITAGNDIRSKDGKPLRLEMIYRKDNGSDKEIAQAFQGLMREIGVDVHIIGYEFMTWYSKAMQGEFNFALNDTYGIPYVPHIYVHNMLKAGVDYPAQQGLAMKDEIDKKIVRLFETGDDREIEETYDYILSTLHQNAVNIPLAYQKEVIVFNKNKIKDVDFAGRIPEGQCNLEIKQELTGLYIIVGDLIEQGYFKDALEKVFSFIRSANKYFDEEQPWITVKENRSKCQITLYTCVQIIANLSILLEPFLPISAAEIQKMLRIDTVDWNYLEVPSEWKIGEVNILFERIDKKRIEEETEKLKSNL